MEENADLILEGCKKIGDPSCIRKKHFVKCEGVDCNQLVAFKGLCVQCIDELDREDRNTRKDQQAAAAAEQKAKDDAWYKDNKRERKPRKE